MRFPDAFSTTPRPSPPRPFARAQRVPDARALALARALDRSLRRRLTATLAAVTNCKAAMGIGRASRRATPYEPPLHFTPPLHFLRLPPRASIAEPTGAAALAATPRADLTRYAERRSAPKLAAGVAPAEAAAGLAPERRSPISRAISRAISA